MKNKNQGFTLVELSIVLVIIGLIVGGIVGGQSLIHAAKLNSVTTDINKFKTAIRAFELQYDALPGDLINAYDYWGVAAGCANTPSPAGCNGNGDGSIDFAESLRAWQQLSLSSILPGNYTGSGNYTLGTNMPKSGIEGAGYWILKTGAFGQTKMMMILGKVNTTTSLNNASLSPIDTKNIDNKLDDGAASTGTVLGVDAVDTLNQCNDSVVASDYQGAAGSANYLLNITTPACRVFFVIN